MDRTFIQILRMVMRFGGWRLIGRKMNDWADRDTDDTPAGRQARRQRRQQAKAGMRKVRTLFRLGRWMR